MIGNCSTTWLGRLQFVPRCVNLFFLIMGFVQQLWYFSNASHFSRYLIHSSRMLYLGMITRSVKFPKIPKKHYFVQNQICLSSFLTYVSKDLIILLIQVHNFFQQYSVPITKFPIDRGICFEVLHG